MLFQFIFQISKFSNGKGGEKKNMKKSLKKKKKKKKNLKWTQAEKINFLD